MSIKLKKGLSREEMIDAWEGLKKAVENVLKITDDDLEELKKHKDEKYADEQMRKIIGFMSNWVTNLLGDAKEALVETALKRFIGTVIEKEKS